MRVHVYKCVCVCECVFAFRNCVSVLMCCGLCACMLFSIGHQMSLDNFISLVLSFAPPPPLFFHFHTEIRSFFVFACQIPFYFSILFAGFFASVSGFSPWPKQKGALGNVLESIGMLTEHRSREGRMEGWAIIVIAVAML